MQECESKSKAIQRVKAARRQLSLKGDKPAAAADAKFEMQLPKLQHTYEEGTRGKQAKE